MRVLIGTVGYYAFVRGYPLGPAFMERLQRTLRSPGISIREMNWGPIAIVQQFESSAEVFDRVVLVGACDRGLPQGTVTLRRWLGGKLAEAAVQERVFEAVTGVIRLDNLLVIGEHFGIWPDETLCVEISLAESTLSDGILAEVETGRAAGDERIIGEQPLTAAGEALVECMVRETCRAATSRLAELRDLEPLTAHELEPPPVVCRHRFAGDSKRLTATAKPAMDR
ncbi:hypothetical protein BH24PSE2_BH24PSE2_06620 [soil metagenome]